MSFVATQAHPASYAAYPVSRPQTGWSGPSAGPSGFSGPPPMPAGINPQAWSAGRWLLNPLYRGSVTAMQSTVGVPAWAPHPSWGGIASASAAAAAASSSAFNPYKRVPNRGDAAYWNTKLLDNPLGLMDMHIRYVSYAYPSLFFSCRPQSLCAVSSCFLCA